MRLIQKTYFFLIILLILTSMALASEKANPLKTKPGKSHLNFNPQSLINPTEIISVGGWSGNGADFSQVTDNVWYLGTDKINYCIISSYDYLLEKHELKELIQESVKQWQLFFKKYQMTHDLKYENKETNTLITFADGVNRKVNFNFQYNENCLYSTDLKFYFGIENKTIRNYKTLATEHPYGFSLRKPYNHRTYHNQGLIWIKNLNSKTKIKHILLHELGHIYGMKHDSVSVMSSETVKNLKESDEYNHLKILGEIETYYWPYKMTPNSRPITLKPANSKDLTSTECRIHKAYKGHWLPEEFRVLFKIAASDCVLLHIEYSQDKDKKSFMLIIANKTKNKMNFLKGKLSQNISSKKSLGPSIFSRFRHSSPSESKATWTSFHIDKSNHYELMGSLKSSFTFFPIKVIKDKGFLIELFLPAYDKWVFFRSF